MGALSDGVTIVPLDSVSDIELPGGSWSRMLITQERVDGNSSSLGYSVFKAGTVLSSVSHETEEVAYVVSGSGRLDTAGGQVRFCAGDAIHIPARTWHAVVNDSNADVVMVFAFPHPAYPPTERRQDA